MVVDIPEEFSCFVPSSFCIFTERISSRLCIWVGALTCEVFVIAVVLFRFKPRIIHAGELTLQRWCKEGVLEDWIP